jgi:hypothetical protein
MLFIHYLMKLQLLYILYMHALYGLLVGFTEIFVFRVKVMDETGVPGENHRPAASYSQQTLLHNAVLSTSCHEWDSNSQC